MSARARVAANGAAMAGLESRIADLAARGEDALAAAWAQVASDFAWQSHPGAMASPVIDDALEAIGLRACPRGPRVERGDDPERVLHVITECAAVGGHSRMAWRWIGRDADRVPTLALTRHRNPVPDALAEAVAARGGSVEWIEGHDLLARARALGALVDRADLVVLHIHPLEVAASIALADRRGRPPVVLVNHADHCFWIGPRVPDLVVSSRAAAAGMCVERRGVAPSRCALLPVPAEPPRRAGDRAAARRALGVPDGAVAMLAMASPYKLAAIDDIGFVELVEPALGALPEAVVLAVGPDDEGAWAAARARTGGRIRALGRQDDPSLAFAAADVFLDGYPCSSLTAALEAAALGIPVVSHRPPRPQAGTYDIDEPALADVHVVATTPGAYAEALVRLARSPEHRADLGARTAHAAAAMHDPERWRAQLESVYDRAREVAGTAAPPAPATRRDEATAHEDAFLLSLHEASGIAIPVQGALLRNGDAFPADPRRGLSIVVHCRDDWDGLVGVLESAMTTCAGLDAVDAVVIDDGSRGPTAELIAGLAGDVRVVRNPAPVGAQASWPAGLDAAAGETALLVTSDVRLAPGWLGPLADALARPGVCAVAPRVRGARGDELCVLASVEAARSGAVIAAVEVPESVVIGRSAPAPLEVPA